MSSQYLHIHHLFLESAPHGCASTQHAPSDSRGGGDTISFPATIDSRTSATDRKWTPRLARIPELMKRFARKSIVCERKPSVNNMRQQVGPRPAQILLDRAVTPLHRSLDKRDLMAVFPLPISPPRRAMAAPLMAGRSADLMMTSKPPRSSTSSSNGRRRAGVRRAPRRSDR